LVKYTNKKKNTTSKINLPIEIIRPKIQTIPFIFTSPHSGTNYTSEFIKASALDALYLRKSEDSFIDELYDHAPKSGAPLLRAVYPRAYIDLNREAYELDPTMFEDTLPEFVITASPRISAGLGTIPKIVSSGYEIYNTKLKFNDAKERINRYYFPYHTALKNLISNTKDKFSRCFLIDCHSMPSKGSKILNSQNNTSADIVIGNQYGKSCSNQLTDFIQNYFENEGLIVYRNDPYAGGFTTRHYGVPKFKVHAIQIEINRGLYMNESLFTRSTGFKKIKIIISNLINNLTKEIFNT
jgi:N-formylglutamate amidohydrolase